MTTRSLRASYDYKGDGVNYWLHQQEDHNDDQDHKIKKTTMIVGNYWL